MRCAPSATSSPAASKISSANWPLPAPDAADLEPRQAWQAASEDFGSDLERLPHRRGGAVGARRVPPPGEMLFRPEEVERVSEAGAGLGSNVFTLAHPHHRRRRLERPVGADSQHERLAALVAAGADRDRLADERGDAEGVERAARVAW